MQLSDFVNTRNLLEDLVHLTSRKPYANIDVALNHVSALVGIEAKRNLSAFVEDDVHNLYNIHVMTYGELPPGARAFQVEPWSEPLEEQITNYFDAPDKREHLSASWLGTVDAKSPRNEAGVKKLAEDYAAEVYRNMTFLHNEGDRREKSPAQILSAVGITRAMLEPYVGSAQTIQTTSEEPRNMYTSEQLIGELHANAQMLGFAPNDIRQMLDNACDDDAGLGASGLAGFMIGDDVAGKHAQLAMWKRQYGFAMLLAAVQSNGQLEAATMLPVAPEPVDENAELLAMMGGIATPAPVPVVFTQQDAPIVELGAGPATGKRTPKTSTPVAEAGLIPPAMLESIQSATGMKSEELGALIGISRATFDNYKKGKGKLYASPDTKAALISLLDARRNAMSNTLGELHSL
jgi:hypothetical protein